MVTVFTRMSFFTVGLLLAGPVRASADDLPGDPAAGRNLVEHWCVSCHEVGPGLHGSGALGAPAFQDVADDSAVTALALRAFLQTPHFDMPNVMLSPADTDNVISYILKLRAPRPVPTPPG